MRRKKGFHVSSFLLCLSVRARSCLLMDFLIDKCRAALSANTRRLFFIFITLPCQLFNGTGSVLRFSTAEYWFFPLSLLLCRLSSVLIMMKHNYRIMSNHDAFNFIYFSWWRERRGNWKKKSRADLLSSTKGKVHGGEGKSDGGVNVNVIIMIILRLSHSLTHSLTLSPSARILKHHKTWLSRCLAVIYA
jgi:hypothetical protein